MPVITGDCSRTPGLCQVLVGAAERPLFDPDGPDLPALPFRPFPEDARPDEPPADDERRADPVDVRADDRGAERAPEDRVAGDFAAMPLTYPAGHTNLTCHTDPGAGDGGGSAPRADELPPNGLSC
jgi:hypothetical protein